MSYPTSPSISVAAQFSLSPAYIAREVAKDWRPEHPEWSEADARFAYSFLLEVYQQARSWWLQHPDGTNVDLAAAHHEIVKAFMRGEQLFPRPGRKATLVRGKALRERQNALWNINGPTEKADLELRAWLHSEGAEGRRPTAAQRRAKRQSLVRKHERHPRTDHPVRAEILGHFQ